MGLTMPAIVYSRIALCHHLKPICFNFVDNINVYNKMYSILQNYRCWRSPRLPLLVIVINLELRYISHADCVIKKNLIRLFWFE